MTPFLVLLLVLAVIATVVMLVRGIATFLKATEEDLKSGPNGPSASSLKQNRMMFGRVFFQAIAVLIVAILLMLKGTHS